MLFELLNATWETVYMTVLSGMIASLLGIPLGVILFSTNHHALFKNTLLHRTLGAITNIVRSVPFVIFMIAVIPLTHFIVGSSIGTLAAIVPLSLSATPFVARLIENALAEVNKGLLEMGAAMGATPFQIIKKILLPEAAPGIIHALTLTLITLVGYTAMAGTIGGGGLGALAINYGYQRFDTLVMIETVVLLIVIVQLIQTLGNLLANRLLARR
jgi:D-methionine transport system permease protein